jgi:hypothetical protein
MGRWVVGDRQGGEDVLCLGRKGGREEIQKGRRLKRRKTNDLKTKTTFKREITNRLENV